MLLRAGSTTSIVADSLWGSTPHEKFLGSGRFSTDQAGYTAMRTYAKTWPERVWAIAGSNGAGRPLAQRLLEAGEQVVDVPAKLAARVRLFDTGHNRKTDARDAHSIAVVAVRATTLRVLHPDGELEALRSGTCREEPTGRSVVPASPDGSMQQCPHHAFRATPRHRAQRIADRKRATPQPVGGQPRGEPPAGHPGSSLARHRSCEAVSSSRLTAFGVLRPFDPLASAGPSGSARRSIPSCASGAGGGLTLWLWVATERART